MLSPLPPNKAPSIKWPLYMAFKGIIPKELLFIYWNHFTAWNKKSLLWWCNEPFLLSSMTVNVWSMWHQAFCWERATPLGVSAWDGSVLTDVASYLGSKTTYYMQPLSKSTVDQKPWNALGQWFFFTWDACTLWDDTGLRDMPDIFQQVNQQKHKLSAGRWLKNTN